MAKKASRFVKIYEDVGLTKGETVFVDRETRVQYLFVHSGYAGGLSIMFSDTGKPLLYYGPLNDDE